MDLVFITTSPDKMCATASRLSKWNNYGATDTAALCQRKCLADDKCNFVVWRPSNKYCSGYSECKRTANWNTALDMVYSRAGNSFVCATGQLPQNKQIGATDANSKDGCAAACSAHSECFAFDFTESTSAKTACRLAKAGGTPRQKADGGNHNRKYCSLAGTYIV